jgi:hypothetical protein
MITKTDRTAKVISEVRAGYHGLIAKKDKLDYNAGYLNLVPFIRLRGRWLEHAGFDINDTVRIHIEPGKLTITKGAT